MVKTIKTSFADLLTRVIFSLILSIIVAIILGLLIRSPVGVLTGILVAAAILWIIYEKYLKRMIRVLFSGAEGYYFSFDENMKVWQKIKHSFCYLGISGNTILPEFRRWLEKEPPEVINKIKFKFLLMNPNAKSLKDQLCFRYNYDKSNLTPTQAEHINQEIEATKKRIESCVATLKQLPIYRSGHLKIRYFDEMVVWWLYIFDDNKAYVGVLEKGIEGKESRVLILKKDKEYPNVFTSFQYLWEKMWEDGIDA